MSGKSYTCRCGLKLLPRRKTRLLQRCGYMHTEEHSALFCADIERWPHFRELDQYGQPQPHPMLFMRLDT